MKTNYFVMNDVIESCIPLASILSLRRMYALLSIHVFSSPCEYPFRPCSLVSLTMHIIIVLFYFKYPVSVLYYFLLNLAFFFICFSHLSFAISLQVEF
jgi:hypothetical protein